MMYQLVVVLLILAWLSQQVFAFRLETKARQFCLRQVQNKRRLLRI